MTAPLKEIAASLKDWSLTVDMEGIAWAVIDREGESANTLSRRVLEELGQIIEAVETAQTDSALRGLVFMSGKAKNFILGADVREFEAFKTEAEVTESLEHVLGLLDRIETLKVPVVVAFDGLCLGGGLELALACHWRIATRSDETRVGFPEVKLGIFPGFNGTARSIRQAGPVNAMQAMLTGGMIRARAAKGQGLIDELVASPQALRWAARKAVLRKRRAKPAGTAQNVMRQWPARGLIANQMRSKTKAKVRRDHYPAPFALIDLFEKHGGDLDAMKKAEPLAFAPLMVSEQSRNLRRVFALSEQLKAQAPKDLAWRPLRAHVIGAGTMGADIAGWCVASGMEVSLQDLNAEAISKGIKAQKKTIERKFRAKPQRDAAWARFIADPEGEHIARADIVIEAIVEKLEVKQTLFRDLETKLKPGAVMATNTSSIMIEEIAKPLADPGRLIGIHFFNPVAQMPLVEVIKGEASRQGEVDKGCAFVTAISKFPLIVKSSPGFLVNRVLAPYMMAAMERVQQGTPMGKIDAAAQEFGMPMGPIELADTVGLDVCAHVGDILGNKADGSRLADLVAGGKLGKKTGEGFYRWKDGKPVKADRDFEASQLAALGKELVKPLIEECEKVLSEGVVANADLVDAGVIFGTGFAPFRGGPLHYARTSQDASDAGKASTQTMPQAAE
ncbi:MAG: 3-hydroxyacyl-CoA dehydrogenase NAD-binding domain-containing protein [Pseudomonadota bacterium]